LIDETYEVIARKDVTIMRTRRIELLLIIVVMLSAQAFAQAVPPAESLFSGSRVPSSHDVPEVSKETFSARVREVNLLFSATDWRGRFVSNLTPADVKVLDNGQQPQSLTYFLRQSDLPLKVGLLIDVSGSVGNFFSDQQQAASIFLQETLRPSDSAAIITFGLESHVAQDFTSNLKFLTNAVQRLSVGESSTAIYDAVGISCGKLSAGTESGFARRVLILITDGEENSSHSHLENAIDAALQSDVIVFALNTNRSQLLTDPMLQKLSKSTGGTVLHAHGARELKAAFRKVNEQLRNQYLLGYKPPHWKADDRFHKVRVTARFGIHIDCRKGYYAVE
jgi:Ca-activated chloride channel family protein